MGTDADREAVLAATEVAQAFVDAFSARDNDAERECLNFPHVRIASGSVRVWEKADDFSTPFDRLAQVEGWNHSSLDSAEPIHSSPEKVHLAVEFSRYDARGDRYATHRAVWIVTNLDGHWGIQARSSYAP